MDTMWLVAKWGGSALVALLAFVWFVVPILKKWKPTWFGPGTVADTVADYADEAVAGGLLGSVALLFKKHGDTEAVSTLGGLWGKAMAWPGVVHSPVAESSSSTGWTVTMAPSATPTELLVAALSADVAALKASVAAQTTSTIPPGAVNGA